MGEKEHALLTALYINYECTAGEIYSELMLFTVLISGRIATAT